MPPLPKQNKSKEAAFGLKFRKWWIEHPLRGEIELKYARNGSLPFSEVSEDQVAVGTLATSKRGILIRKSAGTTGGADYSGLVESPYWIVVSFGKHFYIISLETFLREKQHSKRKSLTEERAKAICVIEV